MWIAVWIIKWTEEKSRKKGAASGVSNFTSRDEVKNVEVASASLSIPSQYPQRNNLREIVRAALEVAPTYIYLSVQVYPSPQLSRIPNREGLGRDVIICHPPIHQTTIRLGDRIEQIAMNAALTNTRR